MNTPLLNPNSSPNPNSIPNPNSTALSNSDQEFITRLAKRIQKSGFITPAVLLLHMTKPLVVL